MIASGPGRSGTDREPAGKLGLPGGGERRALLVANADPFDAATTDRIRQRVQRISDQAEHVSNTDLLERADQNVRDCLRHARLLCCRRGWCAPARRTRFRSETSTSRRPAALFCNNVVHGGQRFILLLPQKSRCRLRCRISRF